MFYPIYFIRSPVGPLSLPIHSVSDLALIAPIPHLSHSILFPIIQVTHSVLHPILSHQVSITSYPYWFLFLSCSHLHQPFPFLPDPSLILCHVLSNLSHCCPLLSCQSNVSVEHEHPDLSIPQPPYQPLVGLTGEFCVSHLFHFFTGVRQRTPWPQLRLSKNRIGLDRIGERDMKRHRWTYKEMNGHKQR